MYTVIINEERRETVLRKGKKDKNELTGEKEREREKRQRKRNRKRNFKVWVG